MAAKPVLIRWGWREQPDMKAIAEAVRDQSFGTVIISEIETGSSEYMIAVAGRELSDAEALAIADAATGTAP